ncbi:serine hydrolase domain-containing protein [Antribacter gilvus]|uniref:serine hydrolase domain-containing protein n=1 Tax=Antribacter gilvus TaxID=2304675 RepID=UPI000F785A9D|nr:serine hydrolase domain-containing protein [Antribacter gilvus]
MTFIARHRLAPLVGAAAAAAVAAAALLLPAALGTDPVTVTRGTVATAPDDGPAAVTPDRVDAVLADALRRAGLPGAAVVITHHDRILYSAGYGHDSTGAAMTARTPQLVASMSKAFTATAVMRLVEAGEVDLDAPVVTYLPAFRPADPRGDRITVRQLLNQTSGLADGGFREMSLPQPRTTAEELDRLRGARLTADPGTRWQYHNPNYHLLAALVEAVDGRSFEDYLAEEVLTPLGMDESRAVRRTGLGLGVADGYVTMYGHPVRHAYPEHYVAGGGGLVSTADDLGAWLVSQTNGGRSPDGVAVLTPESLAVMHSSSAVGEDYGFGWFVNTQEGNTGAVEHGGTHFTTSGTQAFFPATGYGYAVVFNSASSLGAEQVAVMAGVATLLNGEEPEPPARVSLSVDTALAVATFLVVGCAVRGALGARGWAERRGRTRRVLGLTWPVLVVVLAATLPGWAGALFGGRDVPWSNAWLGWPAMVVLVVTTGAAAAVVLACRVVALRSGRLIR